MVKLNQTTIIPFLIALILSFYQMVYMKYLPWFSTFRIIVEFVFLIIAMWYVTNQSELMNHSHELIARAVYQSKWYQCSPDTRRALCVMLRNAQINQHFCLLNGLVELSNSYMVQVFNSAITFINFMRFNGAL